MTKMDLPQRRRETKWRLTWIG